MFKESSQWTPAEHKEKETVGRFLAILTFFLKSVEVYFYTYLISIFTYVLKISGISKQI